MAGRKSKYSLENLNREKTIKWQTAIYIRLSQEDNDNGEIKIESNSVTGQKTLINEFVNENDDLTVYDIYVDDGFSGTNFNRPGFKRMMEDMKNRNINCIIIKDLSRLGRNHYEVGNYIEKIFPLFNIRFISINDRIDSYKDPASINTILVPFKNLINDEYARDTSIKIKSSLKAKKKKGEFVGAFASYGYIKDINDKHKLVIDKEAAEIVKKIFKWKVNEGLGNIAICHRLNDMGILNPTGYKRKMLNQNYNNFNLNEQDYSWCPSTVRNILKNDVYIGNVTQGKRKVKSYKIHKIEQVPEAEWVTVENMHKPIIEKELFEKAQRLRQVDTRVQNSGNLSLWAGILKCADCGRAMHKKYCKNKSGTVYEYYICSTYRKKSTKLCTKHTLKIEELEQSVLETIKIHIELLIDMESTLYQVKKLKTNQTVTDNVVNIKKSKEKEIERIGCLKRGLYEDWKNGDITRVEYLDYKQRYEDDIERLKKYIKNLDKQKKEQKEITNECYQWMENFKKHKNITKLDRDIITELIDDIKVHENKKITIHFKFKNELKFLNNRIKGLLN